MFIRLARVGDVIWLDLGRPQWDAIKITRDGWSVAATPDVKFRRSPGLLALPEPVRGPDSLVVMLKKLINVSNPMLLIAWLVGALRGRKPYPILSVNGEHGTGKTEGQRKLRRLIDPNTADLRLPPKEPRDIMIAALNSHVLAYDNPDIELLRAVRPALARVPGSLLAVVSSPYARRGVLFAAWRRHHDQPDGAVVLVQAATLELNPTFDAQAIATAYEDDPASAAAEYGAEFRSDVESFVTLDALHACVLVGRHELLPLPAISYVAFVDPSGGSADSFTLAVAHRQGDRAVLDLVRETKPPFSPESVAQDYATVLQAYRISAVTGDRYAGEWPREQFRKHGIAYVPSERAKSDIYRDVLPLLNSARIELLDHSRVLVQLGALERRTARGGRDSIDHPPGGHDDLANAAAGALVLAGSAQTLSPESETAAVVAMATSLRRPSSWGRLDDDHTTDSVLVRDYARDRYYDD